jgi:hypothetical protein
MGAAPVEGSLPVVLELDDDVSGDDVLDVEASSSSVVHALANAPARSL